MRLSKPEQKAIADERIKYLFQQADKIFSKDPALSDRYVKIAIDLRNKFKIKLTKNQKKKFCKKCFAYLKPGKTCTVRTKNKFLLYHCRRCGYIRRQSLVVSAMPK